MARLISSCEAVELIRSNMTVAISGFGGYGSPEEVIIALCDKYKQCGEPKNLKLVKGVSVGDYVSKGTSRLFDCDGLVKTLICSHIGLEPSTISMVSANKVMAYMVPLGSICHLFRSIAGKKPGYITNTGLGTFADPRYGGSKANEITVSEGSDIVNLIRIGNEEYLFYPSFDIDVCILRGSSSDCRGNISCEGEPILSNLFEMAAAVKASGGVVIVQVPYIVSDGTINPKNVVIPSPLVDYIVQASSENHEQCFGEAFRPEITGQARIPIRNNTISQLNERKICARRALMSFKAGDVINLGIGMPDMVSTVAAEEGIDDQFTLSIEAGSFGGVPLTKIGFGAAINPDSILSIANTFDLYDGGLLDRAVLGAAEVDKYGNVNVTKFGGRVVGPGGFINISQHAKNVCFLSSFTAGGLSVEASDGSLKIKTEGKYYKYKNDVEQISFSAARALDKKQNVLYITERAVFKLESEGLVLTETAPGIDLKKDVLSQMDFMPLISPKLKLMDEKIFRDEAMGLKEKAYENISDLPGNNVKHNA